VKAATLRDYSVAAGGFHRTLDALKKRRIHGTESYLAVVAEIAEREDAFGGAFLSSSGV